MHVAIVGAGALGAIYGVRLASLRAAHVSFVVRSDRDGPMVIQSAQNEAVRTLDSPVRVLDVPRGADVILVCVRLEQIDEALANKLAAVDAPVVTLTPLLPQDREFLEKAIGPGRLFPGMPGAVGYRDVEGTEHFRYWLPRVAHTLIDDRTPRPPAIDALAAVMGAAKIPCKLQADVFGTNAATTMTFAPLTIGLSVAREIDALFADRELLELALDAAEESRQIGARFGKAAPWADLLVRFTSASVLRGLSPGRNMQRRALKVGLSLARRSSSEAVDYIEGHFGRKLHAQHLHMSARILELGRREGLPHEALAKLDDRLRASAP
jgi:ketopantoate reductase